MNDRAPRSLPAYEPNPVLAWAYKRFFESIEVDDAWAQRRARRRRPRHGRLRPAQPLLRRLLRPRLPHQALPPSEDPVRQRPGTLAARADGPRLAQRPAAAHPRGRRRRSRAGRRERGQRRALSQAPSELARGPAARAHRGRPTHPRPLRPSAQIDAACTARAAGVRLVAQPHHTGERRRRRPLRPERVARQGAHGRAVSRQLALRHPAQRAPRSTSPSSSTRRARGPATTSWCAG